MNAYNCLEEFYNEHKYIFAKIQKIDFIHRNLKFSATQFYVKLVLKLSEVFNYDCGQDACFW